MEEILTLLGAETPFDNKGELTSEGADAYEKLIRITSLLNSIGVITETEDDCEKKFDEIMRLGAQYNLNQYRHGC